MGKKLFLVVSRKALITLFERGDISEEDFRHALFCFVVTAKSVPEVIGPFLYGFVETAEREGRVYWKAEGQNMHDWIYGVAGFLAVRGMLVDGSKLDPSETMYFGLREMVSSLPLEFVG